METPATQNTSDKSPANVTTEDTTRGFGLLTLEEEEDVFVVSKERCLEAVKAFDHCLAGSFLIPGKMNVWAMKLIFKRIWLEGDKITINESSPNFFILSFPSEEAKGRVLGGGPWIFDGNVLLLAPWSVHSKTEGFTFDHIDLWVQIRNMPIYLLTEDDAKDFVSSMGTVIESDKRVMSGEDGDYMRVRLRLDVRKPLRRGRFIQLLEEKRWLDFKYERIEHVCGWCGRMDHYMDNCNHKTWEEKQINEPGYGSWLTFKPPPRKKKIFKTKSDGKDLFDDENSEGDPEEADDFTSSGSSSSEHMDLDGSPRAAPPNTGVVIHENPLGLDHSGHTDHVHVGKGKEPLELDSGTGKKKKKKAAIAASTTPRRPPEKRKTRDTATSPTSRRKAANTEERGRGSGNSSRKRSLAPVSSLEIPNPEKGAFKDPNARLAVSAQQHCQAP